MSEFLKENFLLIIPIIGLIVITFIITQKTCKPAIFYINSKALCQIYGINKNKCKIKVKYCGENRNFYYISINNNNKEYINKNVVSLISFPVEKSKN